MSIVRNTCYLFYLSKSLMRTDSEGIPPCNTYDEWIGVLDLASMWDFQTVSPIKDGS